MTGPRPAGAPQRAAYRRYIREHHPDVGGDSDAFAAGLARLRGTFGAEGDRSRYDAPLEFVSGSARRRRRVGELWRRLRHGRAPGRVR